jgi:large subunit ribosomal protein L7/L12
MTKKVEDKKIESEPKAKVRKAKVEEKSVAKEEKPAIKEEKVVEKVVEKAVEKEEKPAIKEEKVVVKEEKPAAKKEKKTAVSGKIEEFLNSIEKMTVMELSDLVKAIEDRFGVSAAAAAIPVAAAGAAGAAGEAKPEEKDSFNVILKSAGDKKIQVIKEIRALTELGLKEAKALVDEAPKQVKENLPKKEAEDVKAKLETAGATVELT